MQEIRLPDGWLLKQIQDTQREVAEWPEWFRIKSHGDSTPQRGGDTRRMATDQVVEHSGLVHSVERNRGANVLTKR